jgi:hypothetical protein
MVKALLFLFASVMPATAFGALGAKALLEGPDADFAKSLIAELQATHYDAIGTLYKSSARALSAPANSRRASCPSQSRWLPSSSLSGGRRAKSLPRAGALTAPVEKTARLMPVRGISVWLVYDR